MQLYVLNQPTKLAEKQQNSISLILEATNISARNYAFSLISGFIPCSLAPALSLLKIFTRISPV